MLKNKLALITGANRGIGLSILKKFSENGADIIACSRNRDEKFEKLMLNISKEHKNTITPVYFDLSKEDEIERGIEKISAMPNSHKIEIIVNNAGINQVSLFQMTSINKIKEIFDINFFSQLRLTQKLMKIMIRNKKGSIINISSNAASLSTNKSPVELPIKILRPQLSCIFAISEKLSGVAPKKKL